MSEGGKRSLIQKYNTYFLITGIILVVVIAGLIVLAVLTSTNFTNDSNNVSTLQSELTSAESQISSLTDQLETADSQIKVLQDGTSSNSTKISSLNTDLSLAKSQLSSLTNVLNSVNVQISTLETSTSSATSSILSLQTDLSTINSQLTTLQSTVTSLTTRVASLESAINPMTLFSSQTISQSYNTQTTLTTFTPTYFGHLYISGVSSSSTGYIRVYNNTLSTYTDYAFGTGTTVTPTVTGGYSYSIIFGNTDSSGTITATLTAIYYPY